MTDTPLPSAVEAEASVLASILLNPDSIVTALDILTPDDFYRDRHRVIYEAMLALYHADTPVDVVTLFNQLARMNRVEAAGGHHYVTSLLNVVPTWLHAGHYARIVADIGKKRRLVIAAAQAASFAYDADLDPDDAIEKAAGTIYAIGGHNGQRRAAGAWTRDDTAVMRDRLRKLYANPGVAGLPYGFQSLDKSLGGMEACDLVVIAARPSVGKSALALNIAYKLALLGAATAFFSMEMPREQQIKRLIANITGIDGMHLRVGPIMDRRGQNYPDRDEELRLIDTALLEIDTLPLYLDEKKANVPYIRNTARKLEHTHPLDLIIVDYLQLMKPTKIKESAGEYEIITEVSKDLKALAIELGLPIIAIAQLNRASEGRAEGRPALSDLRGSGQVEQDADVVLLLHRTDKHDNRGNGAAVVPAVPVTVMIAKSRHGANQLVELMYDGKYYRFTDTAHRDNLSLVS